MSISELLNIDINVLPVLEDILYYIKYCLSITSDYIYPFIIRYILLLNKNIIISGILIFVLFNVLYITYIGLKKYNFSLFKYIIAFILMPISIIYYLVLTIDALIKKYFIYKIFGLEYPYVKYKIRKEMEEVENILKLNKKYVDRFSSQKQEK